MDILMIYWNSVWSHSQRDRSSLLLRHSSAEMAAYERRLHRPKDRMGGASVVHIDGRPWMAEAGKTRPMRH